MATNFYAHRRITANQQLEISFFVKHCTTHDELTDAIRQVLDYKYDYKTEDSNYKIHLGRQSSHGFFVFAGSLENYIDIRNNLKKNLERYLYDWEIADEDGVVYDFGAFWKRVSKKIKPRYITSNETVIDGHVFTVSKSYWQ